MEQAILQYVLIDVNRGDLQKEQLDLLKKVIQSHAEKHDFAQMIRINELSLKAFEYDGLKLKGIFIPFQKEYFEELTALNWYIKTLIKPHGLELFQMVMPDGSFLGLS